MELGSFHINECDFRHHIDIMHTTYIFECFKTHTHFVKCEIQFADERNDKTES